MDGYTLDEYHEKVYMHKFEGLDIEDLDTLVDSLQSKFSIGDDWKVKKLRGKYWNRIAVCDIESELENVLYHKARVVKREDGKTIDFTFAVCRVNFKHKYEGLNDDIMMCITEHVRKKCYDIFSQECP